MKEDSFYIPINSGSLAHYFGKAIILPAKYFKNKPHDIQNRFSDALLLSEIKWVKNSDCSIEVVLTDEEIKELSKVSEHFFLCNIPIPISRVKSVCFLEAMQKETTIWNINNGAAFIPERIITIENNREAEVLLDNEINSAYEFKSTSELSDKIKRFDIILGGFAFMRLGGKAFMNYSENYFSTLSYFNKLIEEQTINASNYNGFKFSNKYIGLFTKNESEWSKCRQYIYQNLDSKDIEELADKEGVKVEKKLGLLKIDSIDPNSHLYELAILATYGDRKNKSTDNLVADLANGTIFQDKTEDVSLLFGLNNGYTKLSNRYKSLVNDNNVKFTLESKLDYYIIESIYQFVFNTSKTSYSFDYIDNWCPTSKLKENVKGYETYNILDTVIIAKKKQTPLDFFLENYSEEIYLKIVSSINQWLPPFSKIDKKEAIQFFEKQLRNALIASVEALQKKIEDECETNYNLKEQERVESYQKKIVKLLLEISDLKEENAKLKNRTELSHITKELQIVDCKIMAEGSENFDPVKVVQESVIETPVIYEVMSLSELKRIAKERKIKGYTKIENKEDLIKLIKKAQLILL